MDSPVVIGTGTLSSTAQIDLPIPVKKFYQGEPLALGITQIFIGLIGIIFGMLINIVHEHQIFYLMVMMPYWSGILYIISGSLAVAAAWNPRMPLNIGKGILTVLTLLTTLEFCITISVASFGCKLLCRDTFPEKVVVIYQNVAPAIAEQHPPLDCKQSAIHP